MTSEESFSTAPFAPLLGKIAWNVRRGVGTFLTMEFGAPHLSIRDSIEPRYTSDPKQRRRLKRRRVFLAGDWHFWIEHAEWKLSTVNGVLESSGDIGTPDDEWLEDLEGQKLVSAGLVSETRRWTLEFDLGAVLEIWPASYESEDVWSLHGWDGHVVAYRKDGTFAREGDGV